MTKTYEQKQQEDYDAMKVELKKDLKLALRAHGFEVKEVLMTAAPPLANVLIQIARKLTPEEIKVIPVILAKEPE